MSAMILVWDSKVELTNKDCTVCLWNDFESHLNPTAFSIPRLIEQNDKFLKNRYLDWVYRLGQNKIGTKSLIDHLVLRPGFSYWWMNRISEKSNYAHSPHINDAIKLITFDVFIRKNIALDSLILRSGNQDLARCMSINCKKWKIKFIWEKENLVSDKKNLPYKFYDILPLILKGLIKIIHYFITRWPLKGVGLEEWKKTGGKITFFSYLTNAPIEVLESGIYKSLYWGYLPDQLVRKGVISNSLYIFLKTKKIPTAKVAADVIRKLNLEKNKVQIHITLDSFLSVMIFIRTLLDWLRLVFKVKKLAQNSLKVTSNGLEIWQLFNKEFMASIIGDVAVQNYLYFNLFEEALKNLPQQESGIYLYENQPWELTLIDQWRKFRHGLLVGSQHATMLYWDFRYFHDSRIYSRLGNNILPMPDKLAVNGPIAFNTCLESGYPILNLVEVEALRYTYLSEKKVKTTNSIRNIKNVLLLGDFLIEYTRQQIKLLCDAYYLLNNSNIDIKVKAHPACPINLEEFSNIGMTESKESLEVLFNKCDIVYTSPTTTAAVEAYCMGIPIISFLEPSHLNLSPLRGFDGVVFVTKPEELANSLKDLISTKARVIGPREYFNTKSNLDSWNRLLNIK